MMIKPCFVNIYQDLKLDVGRDTDT